MAGVAATEVEGVVSAVGRSATLEKTVLGTVGGFGVTGVEKTGLLARGVGVRGFGGSPGGLSSLAALLFEEGVELLTTPSLRISRRARR
jgi:hypothetical protein